VLAGDAYSPDLGEGHLMLFQGTHPPRVVTLFRSRGRGSLLGGLTCLRSGSFTAAERRKEMPEVR
jgi:hypothetical protein